LQRKTQRAGNLCSASQCHLVFDSALALIFASNALWVLGGTVAWV